jgi:enoyl-CoA hydratase/carnithine racemase
LRLAKRVLRTCAAAPAEQALAAAGALYVEELMAGSDAVEGLRAFTEKRAPVWSHT